MITNIFNYLHISTAPPYINMKNLNQVLSFSCYNLVVFGHSLSRPSYDLPLLVSLAPNVPMNIPILCCLVGKFKEVHSSYIHV